MFDWLFNTKLVKELKEEIERRKVTEKESLLQKQQLEAKVKEQLCGEHEINNMLNQQIQERQGISEILAAQARDLTELQNVTVQTCAILDSLMQLAPIGMAFFDCEARYIRINNWLAKINGKSSEAHVGRTIEEISPSAGAMKRRLKEAMGNNNPIMDDEVSCILPDGQNCIWLVSYYPVFTPDNKRLGIGVVVKDITNQKKLEAELRKSVIEITNSDRQKTEFLAMLAHELRNPLSPIMNSVYLLDSLLKPDDHHWNERKHAYAVIGRQITNMSRLLDDLLDIARINRGKIKLRKEVLDINKLLRRVVDLHKAALDTKHHQVTLALYNDVLLVNADSTRLEQLFGNIYSNAIKYTEPGGHIQITSSLEADWITVRVKDNGIGISDKTLPRMFEIFAQASQPLDRPQGGLGIGLALSKDIVCLHGGKVDATSDGIGLGSEFTIRLPLMPVHEYNAMNDLDSHDPLPISRKPMRVLIVDDNQDAAESLAVLLTHSGHETQMVLDGATALKKVLAYNPDAILLDIGLPGLDGFTCCELLRESGYNGLIVATTGYGSDTDRIRSKEAGFNHHLIKPVNPVELSKLLNKYAESQDES